MGAILLDGQRVARDIQRELVSRIEKLRVSSVTPTLGIALVGAHPASLVYVRNKQRVAKSLGLHTILAPYPDTVASSELETRIAEWSADSRIHGIILQLPLPSALSARGLVSRLALQKDVDCFHPENVGLLAMGTPRFLPPTPAGIHQLLLRSGISPAGKHVVIVGRGSLVGKPLALTLLRKLPEANATVTVCHRETRNLSDITRTADILVVAIGVPRYITAAHVRPRSVVVDVGINKTPEGWVGDVDQDSVRGIVAAISPVPGGVGPMTVTMLLANVVQAAEVRAHNSETHRGQALTA